MTLVDTSVWIDFFSGRPKPEAGLLRTMLADGEDICVCGVVLTEVLQGIREDKAFDDVHRRLSDLVYLPATKQEFVRAAQIYRRLRKAGLTVRKPIDCIISAVCLQHDVALLHNDRDFDAVARYFPLKFPA